MNTINKITAKNTLLKCMRSADWTPSNENLVMEIDKFETLEDFFEYLIITKNASLLCLPRTYLLNVKFMKRLLLKKYSLINEIYMISNSVYQKLLLELDIKKFLKRCKFSIHPQIKRDLYYMLKNQEDELTAVLPK